MSLPGDLKDTADRFKDRISELQDLLREYQVTSIPSLVTAYRTNEPFRARWGQIWWAAARDNGGKLSLTAIGAIVGASLGGVGIAAGGGAIGLPLVAVLGLGGFLAGNEADSVLHSLLHRKREDLMQVTIPSSLHSRLVSKAHELGVDADSLLQDLLDAALGE